MLHFYTLRHTFGSRGINTVIKLQPPPPLCQYWVWLLLLTPHLNLPPSRREEIQFLPLFKGKVRKGVAFKHKKTRNQLVSQLYLAVIFVYFVSRQSMRSNITLTEMRSAFCYVVIILIICLFLRLPHLII